MSLKTVKINVEIGNKDTLQNELNNLGKDVSLKIDLTETNASLKSLVNGIASLNSKLNDIDFSKLISLNETAAHMWKSVVDKDFDNAMLADALCEAYEVDRETAEQDVARVVSQWKEIGLIE